MAALGEASRDGHTVVMPSLNVRELESVDWNNLEHAFGYSADVPDLVVGLWSSDAEDHLWALWERIAHQGTRYSATAPAVPFLVTAALDPLVTVRKLVVELIGFCALGHVDHVLDWPRQYAHQSTPAEVAAWDAVTDDHPRLRLLLSDQDPAVNQAALAVLVWTGDTNDKTTSRIKGLIQSDSDERAVCSGWLAAAVSARLPEGVTPPTMIDGGSVEARFGQAMAAIRFGGQQIPFEAVDELVGTIGSLDAIRWLADCSLLWHEEASLYAARMLSRVPSYLIEHTSAMLLERMKLGSHLGSPALDAYLDLHLEHLDPDGVASEPAHSEVVAVLSEALPIVETWDLSYRHGEKLWELEHRGLPATVRGVADWIASGPPTNRSRRPRWKLFSH